MSDYWLQPERSAPDVVAELAAHGFDALEPGDPLDVSLDADKLQPLVLIAAEHLARLGGAQTGDFLTADAVNRGLIVYMRQRENRSK